MVCVEELLEKYRIFIYYRLYPCCLKYRFSLKMWPCFVLSDPCFVLSDPCFVLSDPVRINVLSELLYVWVLLQNANSQFSCKFGLNLV